MSQSEANKQWETPADNLATAVFPVAAVIKPFIDAGIVPANCRRIIIDFQAEDAVRVYYEVFADSRVIDVMSDLIKDNKIPKAVGR